MQLIPLTPASRCLAAAEAAARLGELPGWRLLDVGGVLRLCNDYPTPDFATSLALANRLAMLAESVRHHPVLTVAWGRLGVQWWTHVLQGLHENDYRMAAACDSLVAEFVQNNVAGETRQSGPAA